MRTLCCLLAVAAAMSQMLTLPTRASYIMSVQQIGPDIAATASGSINTTDLTPAGNTAAFNETNGYYSVLAVGGIANSAFSTYSGLTGPTS